MSESLTSTPWLGSFYDDLFADVLLERGDPEDLTATIDFITKHLRIEPRDLVFDQCCGIGSLSVPLMELGFDIIGVDQATEYIERAKASAAKKNGSFHVADACRFVTDRPCGGAINWWTSFGYALDDAENALMLDCAFRSLRSGGRYLIDYMNVPGIFHSFRPQVVTTRMTHAGRVELRRVSRVDLLAMTMDKEWIFTFEDGRREQRSSRVQLYDPHRLAQLMESSGFTEIEAFGNIRGEPLELDSQRCILLGRKP